MCPNCLGNEKVPGFAPPDRAAGDPGGWKAVPCPVCQGTGHVMPEEAQEFSMAIPQEAQCTSSPPPVENEIKG